MFVLEEKQGIYQDENLKSKEKIMFSVQSYKDLLHNENFAIVQEGVFLLEDMLKGCSFETFISSLKALVDLEPGEETLFEKKGLLSFYRQKDIFFDFYHGNYLAVWSLGFLSQFKEVEEQVLEYLDLSFPIGQSLSALPASIKNLISLRKLDLSGNILSRDVWSGALPEEIQHLQNLVYLNLSCNDLSEMPQVICDLSALSVLSLRGNQLRILPKQIKNLTELRTLNLKSNQLLSLPESFGELYQLVELSLQKNELSSLPESVVHLVNLRYLDLRYNNLSEQEKEKISKMLPLCKIQF